MGPDVLIRAGKSGLRDTDTQRKLHEDRGRDQGDGASISQGRSRVLAEGVVVLDTLILDLQST